VLRTTSQVLSLHAQIEETQSSQYHELAKRFTEHAETFSRLASENLRHRDMALRAYREGVTDAFEVGFLAEPLNPDTYELHEASGELKDVLEKCIGNEETAIRFCLDVASSSSKLIPDLPETFERLVKRKKRSITQLQEIRGGL
jgi:rubrerythrin